ncbi:MAG TPA: hypothetical protein VFU45_00875 [Gemmatimonadales bacterium]|nr:hypothetical protein [Gemmatimonadales bacterium]
MRFLGRSLAAIALIAAPLTAQRVPPDQRGVLQRRIENIFLARVTEELGLTEAQAAQLRGTAERMFARRRALEAESRRLNQLLAGQLRPGVAADPDSVRHLTDSLLTLRVTYARLYQDEVAEMGRYLSPVQCAQYYLLRERLLQRIQQARQARTMDGPEGAEPDPGS